MLNLHDVCKLVSKSVYIETRLKASLYRVLQNRSFNIGIAKIVRRLCNSNSSLSINLICGNKIKRWKTISLFTCNNNNSTFASIKPCSHVPNCEHKAAFPHFKLRAIEKIFNPLAISMRSRIYPQLLEYQNRFVEFLKNSFGRHKIVATRIVVNCSRFVV